MSMRIRIIACICILSVLVSLIFLSKAVDDIRHDPEYTEYSQGIAATQGVYFIENWNERGRLYLMNSSGDVLHMTDTSPLEMQWICSIEVANDSLYAVCASDYIYEKQEYTLYRVAVYDPNLALISATAPFIISSDEIMSSIDISEDVIYLSTTASDGSTASVYSIAPELLTDALDDGFSHGAERLNADQFKSLISLKPDIYREIDGPQFFADAYYNGEDIVIIKDSDQFSGKFIPDLRVKAAVDQMHFNVAQQITLYSNYVIWWVGGLVIWFILLGIIYMLLRRRNRTVYLYIITELMFLIILAGAILFVKSQYERSERNANIRRSLAAMRQIHDYLPTLDSTNYGEPGYYESSEYRSDAGRFRKYASSGYNKDVFYDMFIMKKDSGLIVLDALGHARESASYVYGGAITDVLNQIKKTGRSAYRSMTLDGVNMIAVGLPEGDPSSGVVFVNICYTDTDESDMWSEARPMIILFFSVFTIGSIIVAFIFYLQSLDMKNFERSIRDVALGRTRVDVPKTLALDMASMWNSLSEIGKRMDEISYDKFRIFEAYYRFAPKNIEKIMGKDSIFDVKNGDAAHIDGTLMLLTSKDDGDRERKVHSLANIMSYMNQFEEDNEGILVSQDSALSMLRFFFLKEFTGTSARATQFLHRNASDPGTQFVSGFLYSDSFIYGVAGIKSQSLCYITSEHSKELEDYALWFAELRIPLVVTGSVMEREDVGQIRHIGFIILDSDGKRVELYEAIDAESARLRQLKLTTRDKFEKAMELFYSKEFYLARNQFSEILKDSPEDALCRWYLFESERYLNGESKTAFEGELRIG